MFFCFSLDYFVVVLFAFVVLVLVFFSTTPRDWQGRTSPKWPILCWARHKTISQSVNQPNSPSCWAGDAAVLGEMKAGLSCCHRWWARFSGFSSRPARLCCQVLHRGRQLGLGWQQHSNLLHPWHHSGQLVCRTEWESCFISHQYVKKNYGYLHEWHLKCEWLSLDIWRPTCAAEDYLWRALQIHSSSSWSSSACACMFDLLEQNLDEWNTETWVTTFCLTERLPST